MYISVCFIIKLSGIWPFAARWQPEINVNVARSARNECAWWTLSLELVSKWRNDSQLCGMWHVAKWPKGPSKLKTQDWCVSSVIFDKFPKCLNNTLFIIAANELRDESICLSHASIPFFFCSSLLFSSVVVVVYVAYFRRLLFTSNWGWARKQMHCASECVFIVSLWGVQFDQRWRKNFAWFAPHINLFNWHFCHAAERSFIIKSGNVYKKYGTPSLPLTLNTMLRWWENFAANRRNNLIWLPFKSFEECESPDLFDLFLILSAKFLQPARTVPTPTPTHLNSTAVMNCWKFILPQGLSLLLFDDARWPVEDEAGHHGFVPSQTGFFCLFIRIELKVRHRHRYGHGEKFIDKLEHS